MTTSTRNLLRWVGLTPSAVAAAVLGLILFFPLALAVMLSVFDLEIGQAMWLARAAGTVGLVTSFILAAVWVAPTHKRAVAIAAVVVAFLWYGPRVVAGLSGEYPAWPVVIGFSGLLAASASYILSRRMFRGGSAA